MQKLILGAALASVIGSAAAGPVDRTDSFYAGNDYSAKVYYRLDFGGASSGGQTLGLRFDNELANSRGAPAVFQLAFDGSGTPSARLYGLELRGPALSAGESGVGGFFSSLTGAQWVGLGFTALVFGVVVDTATKNNDTTTTASGSGG